MLSSALAPEPQLLLLDEPYSNLDFTHKTILKSVIEDIAAQLQITCIMVSHDPQDVLSWADNIIVMQNGTIAQQADPQTIYK